MLGFEDISASPRGNSIHTIARSVFGSWILHAPRVARARFPMNQREEEFPVFARKWSRRTIAVAAASVVLLLVVAVFQLRSGGAAEISKVPFSDLLRDLNGGRV